MSEYSWGSIFAVHEYFLKSQISLNHLIKLSTSLNDPSLAEPVNCLGLYWEITGHPFRTNVLNSEKSLPEIKYLFIQNLNLDNIFPIKVLGNLEIINAYNNCIDSLVPLKNLAKLKEIDFSRNKIHNLEPISNLTNLETINLSDNHITDFTKLYKLTNLKKLYLSGNKIENVFSVSNLKQLEELDLSFNGTIDDLDRLQNCHNLKWLQLYGNNLETEKVISLGRLIRNCKIFFNPLDLWFDYDINGGYLHFELINGQDVPFLINFFKNNKAKHLTIALLDKKFKSQCDIIEEMKNICRNLIAIDDRKDNIVRDIKRELFFEETSNYVRGQFDY